MDEMLQNLLAQTGDRAALPIALRIHDGDRYASVDADTAAMSIVLFCGTVAEEVGNYASALEGSSKFDWRAEAVEAIAAQAHQNGPTWVDQIERGQLFAEAFANIFRRRAHEERLAASDILRLEVIGFARENPSVFQIVAGGLTFAVIALAFSFSAAQLMHEAKSDECLARAYEMGKAGGERLDRIAKMQGHWTPELVQTNANILDAQNAAIAACNSVLSSVKVRAHGKGVDLDISADQLRGFRLPDGSPRP